MGAISLRELSPIYQKFIKLYQIQDGEEGICDVECLLIEDTLNKLIGIIISCQLCDLLSLAGLHDLKNQFENAYSAILSADHLIHSLNQFNKQYAGKICRNLLDENGDFRLSLKDIIPLKDIEPLLSKKNK